MARVSIGIVFESGVRIGPGKAKLLESIRDTGSISAAARDMGNLIYAGRVGTGMPVAELERLYDRLQPLAISEMPLAEPPPRGGRFGSPLVLSRVHCVRPEIVVEVSYVEMTPDGLLRHVSYMGEQEDKPATDVRRDRIR